MSIMHGRKRSILRRIGIFSKMKKQIDYKNLAREIFTLAIVNVNISLARFL